jgi:hypothetical protein
MYTGRTAKYVEAMTREGKSFNYKKWLHQVQEEEAQAKRVAAGSNSAEPAMSDAAQIKSAPNSAASAVIVNNVATSRNPSSQTGSPNSETSKKSLQKRLIHVGHAWDDFQGTRDRDAVYKYLRTVFSIVQHYRWKGQIKKLIRRAFRFAELPFDKNVDPFAVIIRCTCEQQLDRKTISKWSRALRYAAQFKKRTPLKTFMKNRGGINACANLYTQHFGRSKG